MAEMTVDVVVNGVTNDEDARNDDGKLDENSDVLRSVWTEEFRRVLRTRRSLVARCEASSAC
jgi:hypothetical protein